MINPHEYEVAEAMVGREEDIVEIPFTLPSSNAVTKLLEAKDFSQEVHKNMFLEEVITLAFTEELLDLTTNAEEYLRMTLNISTDRLNDDVVATFISCVRLFSKYKKQMDELPFVTVRRFNHRHIEGFIST